MLVKEPSNICFGPWEGARRVGGAFGGGAEVLEHTGGHVVRRCRLILSKPVLTPPVVSPLETRNYNIKICF